MKTDLKYLVFLFLFTPDLFGQNRQFNLLKANAQLFKGNLYVYGFSTLEKKAAFCIYKLNTKLKTTDSLVVPLGKTATENYLQVSSDTLHDYLNIYLQKKEKKLVSILRFDKNFGLIANIDNVDIARLNSISDFENEVFYSRNEIFAIKTQKDSTGVQFYLNKYTLKSETKNFEYAFTWQFPFDKKNINTAHVFYADRRSVLLYVNILSGQKAGQWILNINSSTGKLIRGSKLNDKGELNSYQFGNFVVDSTKRNLLFMGQKFTEAQFKQSEKILAISNAPAVSVYLVEIDSLGEITNKQDFKIPVSDPKTTSKKIINNYIVGIEKITKNKEGKISFETDIFKNTDNTLCYLYSNTVNYNITMQEEVLVFEKNTISSNPQIEKFYFSPDKLDMNGKLCVDSLNQFERIFYKSLTFPVKQLFKTDAEGNPIWLLTKSNPKKNTVSFSYLAPVKKIYQVSPIEEISKSLSPQFINLLPGMFVITRQVDENIYELRSYSW